MAQSTTWFVIPHLRSLINSCSNAAYINTDRSWRGPQLLTLLETTTPRGNYGLRSSAPGVVHELRYGAASPHITSSPGRTTELTLYIGHS